MDTGGPTRLTKVEVADMVRDIVALQHRVEAEWAAGKRDGIRQGLFGVSESLRVMLAAFDEGDVAAFSAALGDLGNARMTLAMHVGRWKREKGS